MANSANKLTSQIISFNYDFYGDPPKNLTFQGDAHIPFSSTFLRLTKTDDSGNPQTYSAGRVVHNTPVPFWGDETLVDLETTIKFIIRPVDNNPADGLVFFIAPVGTTIPKDRSDQNISGETFGVFDSAIAGNRVFAVEFDTFVNPDVDPSHRHIGINIESLKSKRTIEVDEAIFGQVVTAQINYLDASKAINVKVTAGSKKYEVSNVYDLRTVLAQKVQVGLAASTGGNVAIHDVVSWYFKATVVTAN